MPSLPTDSITVQKLHTAHIVRGEGKPLLMLHGWGANIDLVWPLAERMVPLGYRVYLLDLPGFGGSAPPPVAWSVFDYANFTLAYMQTVKLDRVYLFGHSFGGRLGLILGADHGDRIIKMALANSAGIRAAAPPLARLRLGTYKAIRDGLYRIGARKLADTLRSQYNARYGSTDYQQTTGVMRETFVKVVNQDLLEHAARVQPGTLLFWGDQDTQTPLWQGQKLEQTIPDAGLIVYDGAGHYSYLDRPGETARVMDYFFSQEQPPANRAVTKQQDTL